MQYSGICLDRKMQEKILIFPISFDDLRKVQMIFAVSLL